MVVDVQRGEQQRVEVGQPGPHLGVGGRRVGRPGLRVQPPVGALLLGVGGGLLGRGDGQVGVAPDQVALLRGGRVRALRVGHLGGLHPLHVPDDAHA